MTLTTLPALLIGIVIFIASFYNGAGMNLTLLPIMWAIVFLLFFLLQKQSKSGFQLPIDFISKVMLAYIGWIVVIYQFSPMKEQSFFTAWQMAALPVMYILWKINHNNDLAWEKLWPVLLLIGTASALFGFYDYYEIFSQGYRPYVNGQRYDPNNYATILLAIIMPTSYYILCFNQYKNHNKLQLMLLSSALYLMVVAMLFTDSRGIFIIWIVLQIMLLLYLFKEKRLSQYISVYLGVVFLAAITYYYLSFALGSQYNFSDINPFTDPFTETAPTIRSAIWKSTLNMYYSHPFMGTGLGTFPVLYHTFRLETSTLGVSAHNDYIQFLQEGGPINLAFLLFFVITICLLVIRLFLRKNSTKKQSFITGESYTLALVCLGFCVEALVNFTFSAFILAIISGLYLSRATDTLYKRKYSTFELSKTKKTMLASLFLIPLSLLILDAIVADVFTANKFNSTRIFKIQNTSNQHSFASLASIFRPNNSALKIKLITHYQKLLPSAHNTEQQALIKNEIEAVLLEFKKSSVYSAIPARMLGDYMYNLNKFRNAEIAYEKAITINPWDLYSYIGLANVYQATGRYTQAMILLMNKTKHIFELRINKLDLSSRILRVSSALAIAKKENNSNDVAVLSDLLISIQGIEK